MTLSYALAFVGNMLRFTWAVPWVPYAAVLGVVLIVVAVISKRRWVHWLIAATFLSASAAYSVWVLPIGVMLAGLGLALVIAGAIWKYTDRSRPHVSGGLVWPGLGLLVAPLANIFVVMPILRTAIH
jgi:hypothetical protein